MLLLLTTVYYSWFIVRIALSVADFYSTPWYYHLKMFFSTIILIDFYIIRSLLLARPFLKILIIVIKSHHDHLFVSLNFTMSMFYSFLPTSMTQIMIQINIQFQFNISWFKSIRVIGIWSTKLELKNSWMMYVLCWYLRLLRPR